MLDVCEVSVVCTVWNVVVRCTLCGAWHRTALTSSCGPHAPPAPAGCECARGKRRALAWAAAGCLSAPPSCDSSTGFEARGVAGTHRASAAFPRWCGHTPECRRPRVGEVRKSGAEEAQGLARAGGALEECMLLGRHRADDALHELDLARVRLIRKLHRHPCSERSERPCNRGAVSNAKVTPPAYPRSLAPTYATHCSAPQLSAPGMSLCV
jgi:hypothetical protein